jgi:aminoglycoside phosphotransferase (APT) family kinase protein
VSDRRRGEDAYAAAKESRRWSIEELTGRLSGWLVSRLGAERVELLDARYPVGAGTSSETLLTTVRWSDSSGEHARDMVFRMAPDRFQLFLEPDFSLQHRVLSVLHRERLARVPEVLFIETDARAIGLPFFAMERVRGNVPVTSPPYNQKGFLADATPAQRRIAWTSAVEELGRIARVPLDRVPFLTPAAGGGGLEQQLAYWHRSRDWVTRGEPHDVMLAYAEWLDANLPSHRPHGFAWGDARIGNMVFGDDFRLAGVLDWEQVNDGGIRQDLGWWVYFDDFNSTARGLAPLDGLGSRQETIDLWESIVGEPAGDLTWYEVFSGYKVAILSTRTLTLVGDPDARTRGLRMGLVRPAELTGIALP